MTNPTYVVGAMAVRKGIEFYLKTGMRVNKAYTPDNMRRAVAQYTGNGKTYARSRSGLKEALADIDLWVKKGGP